MRIKGEICRIYLKVALNQFEEIHGLVKQIFNVLLLRLDLDITKNPIVCWRCIEVAKICLNFKYACISTEKSIALSFFADRQTVKQDIKVVYRDNGGLFSVKEEDLHVCRFCLIPFERSNFVSMHAFINETMFEMLSEYIPEMDFDVIENPIICANCRENLGDYFKFVQNCLNIEEKIKLYCKKEGIDSKGPVKIEELQYLFKDFLEYSDKYPQMWKGMDIKKEYISLEENFCENTSEMMLDGYSDKYQSKENGMENKLDIICLEKGEPHSDITQKDTANLLDPQGSIFNENISGSKMYRCPVCAYESKRKFDFTRHILVHKDVSEVKMYKCPLCAYKAKLKYYIDKHMLMHKEVTEIKMYKCSLCTSEARRKGNLNNHMLIHKDASQIKMYKCSLCTYEGKQKSYLDRHMLVHKDVSEIKMYKCSLCTYEAKQKMYLNRHVLVHRNVSETKMYKCSLCTYEGKRKSYLDKHVSVHKDVTEMKMYKCSLCAYETKQKRYLDKHNMLVHKDDSERKIYKCSLCTFECKYRSNYNAHLNRHMIHNGRRNKNVQVEKPYQVCTESASIT